MDREQHAMPSSVPGQGPAGFPNRQTTPSRNLPPSGPGPTVPGLDAFWIEADRQASAQHPIERELGHRLDTLARYTILIEAALADGRDRAAEILLRQREREEAVVRRLRRALRRTRGWRG